MCGRPRARVHTHESTCACSFLPLLARARVRLCLCSPLCAWPSLSPQLGRAGGLRHSQRKEQPRPVNWSLIALQLRTHCRGNKGLIVRVCSSQHTSFFFFFLYRSPTPTGSAAFTIKHKAIAIRVLSVCMQARMQTFLTRVLCTSACRPTSNGQSEQLYDTVLESAEEQREVSS